MDSQGDGQPQGGLDTAGGAQPQSIRLFGSGPKMAGYTQPQSTQLIPPLTHIPSVPSLSATEQPWKMFWPNTTPVPCHTHSLLSVTSGGRLWSIFQLAPPPLPPAIPPPPATHPHSVPRDSRGRFLMPATSPASVSAPRYPHSVPRLSPGSISAHAYNPDPSHCPLLPSIAVSHRACTPAMPPPPPIPYTLA